MGTLKRWYVKSGSADIPPVRWNRSVQELGTIFKPFLDLLLLRVPREHVAELKIMP
ncbi:hypothetical protein L227DRAFT_582155 [Lentinus tigrinus ALCF2SS1-6]|uniref:Uncharacterized protein n=1 Tax=Lentinus tigrinus ALCF2SS1-6 TaxID=1328759 RepID=A0A5C2RMX5_9APHY|nr:hypothetical protein L227DRAFT_582155 [Lentinus tigrinus ALCF2SS1-6]